MISSIKNMVKKLVPSSLKSELSDALRKVEWHVKYSGDTRYCPVCGKSSRVFGAFGEMCREDAFCFYCGSVERHRLLWLFFQKKTNLLTSAQAYRGRDALHIAAESCFEERFKKLFGRRYITADLYDPRAMVRMDITSINYPDESFDVIICNHVLEHIADDKKAMSELYRVLRKSGWAILLVPIADIDTTYEDFLITTGEGRAVAFGHTGHVRKYGRDYIDRLRSAGFTVSITKPEDLANDADILRMRLRENNAATGFCDTEIYYCEKN